jgi:inner membrane protein
MDNITHTLIGTLVGEAISRVVPRQHSNLEIAVRRSLCVSLAAIGSNLPDSDLLYAFIGGKVNYLLHHRGHTHTVVIALLLGALVYAITLWGCRRRGLQPSRQDRWLLAGVLGFTPLLHIAMDFTNNYGVHPFWPFDNRWFYGDSVFIIEPLFWAACAPLAFIFTTSTARALIVLLLTIALGLCFFSGLVPSLITSVYIVIVAMMLLIGWRAPTNKALVASIGLWLGTTVMFMLSANEARARVDEIAARQFPEGKLVDRVVTPMPANPLCWDVMLVQQADASLVLRRAILTLAPSLLRADQCPSLRLGGRISAPLTEVPIADTERVKWYGQVASPVAELTTLARTNCEVAAAMHFIRAPWLAKLPDGEQALGDLRYDREPALGFAELAITDQPSCPPFVPPWIEPRRDILNLFD